MKKLLFPAVFAFVLFLAGCSKDPKAPVPTTNCSAKSDPLKVGLNVNFDQAQRMSLDSWNDGWVALNMDHEDRVVIYNDRLEEVESMAIKADGVVCLADGSLLVLKSHKYDYHHPFDPTFSVWAWFTVGYNGCQLAYSYGRPFNEYSTFDMNTELYHYDRNGNQLGYQKVKGYAENIARTVAQAPSGTVFMALENLDTAHTRFVIRNGSFMDTVLQHLNEKELWLYEWDLKSGKLNSTLVAADLKSDHSAYQEGHLFLHRNKFWYAGYEEALLFGLQGDVLKRAPFYGKDCLELLRDARPSPQGMIIFSDHVSGDQPLYEMDENFEVTNVPNLLHTDASTGSARLIASDAGNYYMTTYSSLRREGSAPQILWQRGSGDTGIIPFTFKRGCNGAFYGIASGGNQYFLVRLSEDGSFPPGL